MEDKYKYNGEYRYKGKRHEDSTNFNSLYPFEYMGQKDRFQFEDTATALHELYQRHSVSVPHSNWYIGMNVVIQHQ